MLVKSPPTKILPSACTAMESTSPFAFGSKVSVERAVGIQAGNIVARHAQNAGEAAADESLAVGLNRAGENPVARTWPQMLRLSVWSSRAVRFQPGDVIARLSANAVRSAESAADQDLAVRLHRD